MTQLIFEHTPIKDNNEPLVDLAGYPFVLEAAYFNQGLSDTDKMHPREEVADKLLELQKSFNGKYRFKIWDGYRPRNVQDNIFVKYRDELSEKHPEWDEDKLDYEAEMFVTNANKQERIPPHATGGAIDLTLVDAEGTEFDMGTEFDHFGPDAASYYFEKAGRSEEIRDNQRPLREPLIKAGFNYDIDEWWHFNWGNQMWAAGLDKPFAFYGEAFIS